MLPESSVFHQEIGAVYMESVFLERPAAGQILGVASRRRRANSFFLEEMLPGDLERECHEERCSQEEATEIFRTTEKTMEFWYKYTNLDPCRTNPCQNGGICTLDRGHFLCLCSPQYSGKTCESEVLQCYYRNGGCMQYCSDLLGGAGVQCGCADGFKLDPDGHSCSETVAFPCGRQQSELSSYQSRSDRVTMETDAMWDAKSTDGWAAILQNRQRNGRHDAAVSWGVLDKPGSPWQVLLRRSDGYGFCGGTLVSDRWVVSAAHCLEETVDHVTIGDYDKHRPDPGEQLIKVQKVVVHPHFHSFTFDSDIALLLLAQPIARGNTAIPACLPDPHLSTYLLQAGNRGVVTGWGLTQHLGRSSRFLRKVTLPVVSYPECIASTEQVITDNMFCAGYLSVSQDACSGDSGGPFLVNYRGTWFLTGVVSWGEKCAAVGKFGVYTRLGNFLSWIRDTMRQRQRDTVDPRGLRDTVDPRGLRDTVDTPEIRDSVDTPEIRDSVDTPEIRDSVDTPEIRDTVDTPEIRDSVDTPEIRDTVDPPEIRDSVDTPEIRDTVDTPEIRDNVDTPEIRDTVDTPEIRDTVDPVESGLRDTVDPPNLKETESQDTGTIRPELRDTVDLYV
ncbi:coagulation factor VII [Perca flavescens]|uniref:coagulation factor VII n=1 Tax=Perca flavescens TaxID=8167 RepID=UPI00106E40E4|nr:coagulation factor VII-like [Perca flavescens]